MTDILNLTFEIQLMLVCGYFSYSISSIGRRINHSVEDKLFQIIAFGFLSLIIYQMIIILYGTIPGNSSPAAGSVFGKTLQGLLMIFISIFIGGLWKAKVQSWMYRIMKEFGVSNEDHFPTVLGSIMHGHSNLTWDYIHLHLNDGRTIRSDMVNVQEKDPIGSIPLVDAQGNVALYVTKIYKEKGDEVFDPKHENGSFKLSYYPKEKISGIEIAWRKPT
jgi:hypothetical protein